MQIRGKEVDFRISRLSDASAMNLALKHMEENEKEVKKQKNIEEVIKSSLTMFRDFFKETTGQDVLADCEDLYEAKVAYYGFLKEVEKQKKELIEISMDDIK